MLTDIERKMLRILHNYSTVHHHMPSPQLLRAKTGRNEAGIAKVLAGLAEKGYIDWSMGSPISKVVIIHPFEKGQNWWDAYR